MLDRTKALAIMQETGSDGEKIPFSISFYTWDDRKQKGGRLLSFENCITTGSKHHMNSNGTVNIRIRDTKYHDICVHRRLIKTLNGHQIAP